MSTVTFYVVIAVAILVVAIFVASYVKAPPAVAFIISGLSKSPRVLIGKGGFRIPFFERLDKVYLGQISVDIKTGIPVPTQDFINVDVDAVAKIRVTPNEEGIRLAAKNFLNMQPLHIAEQLKDSLQLGQHGGQFVHRKYSFVLGYIHYNKASFRFQWVLISF